ncbi:MAG TPA: 23S rRNA (pseudouridine(1915)-N(3))-methyltransferase RlmH [Thermoanaerobaculia bacterium]|nr:23S rRNA (pseudouridine(1915)-N(3))-methyltransferase RlmH [Thermoanaerobaculia bacterium]
MREIVVLWLGRRQREWDAVCEEYRGRVDKYLPAREVVLKPMPGDGAERLRAEAASIRRALPQPHRLVTLDRRGRPLSSEALSTYLQKSRDEWPHALAFVVGSDLGLDADLVSTAHLSLSLSALTLPHQLARLVLWEQLYRGLSLTAGIKYHRAPL